MASVRKRGKTYSARWLQADKSYSEKGGFATREQARLFGMEQEIKVKRGRGIRPAMMKVTVKEYIEDVWRFTLDIKKQSKADYAISVNKYIIPYFGSKPMSEIKPADIQAWMVMLKQEEKYFGKALSPYTVQKHVNQFASILRQAKDNHYIEETPFSKVKRTKVKPLKKAMPLEIHQVEEIAAAMPDHLKLLIWLPFFTGVRPSEALGITKEKLDFVKKEIRIDQQISRYTNLVLEPNVKTSSSERTVPMSRELEKLLLDHIEVHGYGPHGLLFRNRDGKVLRYALAARAFRVAARPLGIPEREGLHVLRHTFASTLIRSGKSVKVIQELLGHKDASETWDTYAHLFPDDKLGAVKDLDDIFLASRANTKVQFGIVNE